jgi:hypothetical protein
MISDRLKDIIYKKLCEDLSHVEIIEYKGEIWFIDRDNKYWYFIYYNGEMWWRYSFFTPFFSLFSLINHDEFTPILSSWLEDILNHKINKSIVGFLEVGKQVEEVLNCKVTSANLQKFEEDISVDKVLNHKVTTTRKINLTLHDVVEHVLNNDTTE